MHYCLSVRLYDPFQTHWTDFCRIDVIIGLLKEYFEPSSYTAYSDQIVAEILTRLRPRRPNVRIPAKEKDFLFFRTSRSTSLLLSFYRSYFLGVNRPGSEVDHSFPSGVDFKNEWGYSFREAESSEVKSLK